MNGDTWLYFFSIHIKTVRLLTVYFENINVITYVGKLHMNTSSYNHITINMNTYVFLASSLSRAHAASFSWASWSRSCSVICT